MTGIIHYILIKKEKKIYDKEQNNENNNAIQNKKYIKSSLRIEFIFNDETRKTKLFHKIIFLISFIDFLCQLCFYFGCHTNKDIINDQEKKWHNIDYLYSFLVIDIIARYLFSILILKTNFYFHHYLSFLIDIIILLILFIIDIIYKMNEYNLYFLILSFFQYVLYSLEDIINKIALIKLFIHPESLLFYKGLYSLIYFSIFTLFLAIFKDLKLNIEFWVYVHF